MRIQVPTHSATFARLFMLGAILAAPCLPAAAAADECLSAPTGTAAKGQHWYYRLERATHRKCWYVRDISGGNEHAAAAPKQAPPAAAQPTAARELKNERPSATAASPVPVASWPAAAKSDANAAAVRPDPVPPPSPSNSFSAAEDPKQPVQRDSDSDRANPSAALSPWPETAPRSVQTERVTLPAASEDQVQAQAPAEPTTAASPAISEHATPAGEIERKTASAAASGHGALANAMVFLLASLLAGVVFLMVASGRKRGLLASRWIALNEAAAVWVPRLKRAASMLWTGPLGARRPEIDPVSPLPERITMARHRPAGRRNA
jgi:hypothetical protein